MHILSKQTSNHVTVVLLAVWARFNLTVGLVDSELSLISNGFANHKEEAECAVEPVILGSLL